MTLATEFSRAATNRNNFLARLAGWITVQLDRQKTIRSLSACRKRELHDVGIIAQDIVNLKSNSGLQAIDEMCRNAGIRSGNW
jgi:uncharacterized protein YjiS (DUF1127 family)